MKIIQLKIAAEGRRLSVEEAWQRFVDADARAKATKRLEDGLDAGAAYRDFLELFVRRAS